MKYIYKIKNVRDILQRIKKVKINLKENYFNCSKTLLFAIEENIYTKAYSVIVIVLLFSKQTDTINTDDLFYLDFRSIPDKKLKFSEEMIGITNLWYRTVLHYLPVLLDENKTTNYKNKQKEFVNLNRLLSKKELDKIILNLYTEDILSSIEKKKWLMWLNAILEMSPELYYKLNYEDLFNEK